MSHVTITCPCCEITGRVRKRYAGRNVACRHCGNSFRMPPVGDCIGELIGRHAKTLLVKVKSATRVKASAQSAKLHAMRKLILLREKGIITQREYEELRRKLKRR